MFVLSIIILRGLKELQETCAMIWSRDLNKRIVSIKESSSHSTGRHSAEMKNELGGLMLINIYH